MADTDERVRSTLFANITAKNMIRILIMWLFGCLMFASVAAARGVAGYYETKPDSGGARNLMCITSGPGEELAVDIETAYCPGPSPECYNVRIDSIQFNGRLAQHSVHYDDGHGCKIDITFHRLGASVLQTPSCRDEERHRDLEAGGTYKLVKSKVDGHDCAP